MYAISLTGKKREEEEDWNIYIWIDAMTFFGDNKKVILFFSLCS